jgi:hypothetical protein
MAGLFHTCMAAKRAATQQLSNSDTTSVRQGAYVHSSLGRLVCRSWAIQGDVHPRRSHRECHVHLVPLRTLRARQLRRKPQRMHVPWTPLVTRAQQGTKRGERVRCAPIAADALAVPARVQAGVRRADCPLGTSQDTLKCWLPGALSCLDNRFSPFCLQSLPSANRLALWSEPF